MDAESRNAGQTMRDSDELQGRLIVIRNTGSFLGTDGHADGRFHHTRISGYARSFLPGWNAKPLATRAAELNSP